tara:strand:+ start:310 stop:810 length:501 start_codon:yes stop_codon:yes gene_type:complete
MINYHWSITGIQEVSINSKDLWEIISTPSNLENFHPFCLKNPVIKWPGEKSIDEVHYYNGLILERNIENWFDKKGYDLFIGKKDGKQSFVSWEIQEISGKTSLKITIYPWIYNQGFKIIQFLPFFIFVKPQLQKYINSVLKGLNYFINSNKPVIKNQFGSHRLFSN